MLLQDTHIVNSSSRSVTISVVRCRSCGSSLLRLSLLSRMLPHLRILPRLRWRSSESCSHDLWMLAAVPLASAAVPLHVVSRLHVCFRRSASRNNHVKRLASCESIKLYTFTSIAFPRASLSGAAGRVVHGRRAAQDVAGVRCGWVFLFLWHTAAAPSDSLVSLWFVCCVAHTFFRRCVAASPTLCVCIAWHVHLWTPLEL